KSVVSVQARTRSADDFDAVNEVDVQEEFGADRCAVGKAVVDAMPIDHQEYATVVIGRIEAAHPEEGVGPVVADIKTPHAVENVGKGAITVSLALLGMDDGDGRGSLGDFLFVLRGGLDYGNLQLHELFQAQLRCFDGFFG